MILNIAAVIVAGAMVVLVFFLIPLILELRRTATTVRETIVRMEAEIRPTIAEVNRSLTDLRILTDGLRRRWRTSNVSCPLSVKPAGAFAPSARLSAVQPMP